MECVCMYVCVLSDTKMAVKSAVVAISYTYFDLNESKPGPFYAMLSDHFSLVKSM